MKLSLCRQKMLFFKEINKATFLRSEVTPLKVNPNMLFLSLVCISKDTFNEGNISSDPAI